jgi:WD40 repeat protein
MPPGVANNLQSLQGWKLPARVVRVLGDPRYRVEGQVLALHPLWDGTTLSIEEPGILKKWNTLEGQELQRNDLSDLEMLWAFGGDTTLHLASAADDLTFWNVTIGEAIKTISQPAWVTALAFRADGTMLATGHDDGRVRLWDAKSAKLVREWKEENQAISSLAFSADGKQLAAATEDRRVNLFDAVHGLFNGSLNGHTDRISRIAWHPGGRYLATASWDTTARLWDAEKGEQLYILNGQADQVHAVTFSPDGSLLASADSESVIWLWHPFEGKVYRQLRGHLGEVTQLAFTPDGKHLLSGGGDGRMMVWDAQTGKNVLSAPGESTFASRVRLSPAQDQVAAILGGRSIFVWDTLQGKRLGTMESLPSQATALTYLDSQHSASSQKGDGVKAGQLISGHNDGQLVFWDTESFETSTSRHEHTARITCIAVDAGGQRLATGGSVDGYVYVWSLTNHQPILLIPGATDGCTVETLAFIPNSNLLAVAGMDWKSSGQEGRLCIWDLSQAKKVVSQPMGSMAVAARPDGKQLAVASLTESICLFQLPGLELERELEGHDGLVTALNYTSDGQHLLSTSEDGTVRVWELATGKEVQILETDVSIRDLSISADGRFVYTANANATAYVIDLQKA